MNTQIKKYLIAEGNPTLLVSDILENKNKLIQNFLGKTVEQIGFIKFIDTLPYLQMMGNELCINACLAFAFSLENKQGAFQASGTKQKIKYIKDGNFITLELILSYKFFKNVVLLPGIGYLKTNKLKSKEYLKNLCRKYKKSAFGILITKKNQIFPYVYVKKTDSFIKESACGSGSVAFNLLNTVERIIQATGQSIFVKRIDNKFFITAKVNEVEFLKGGDIYAN